MPLQDEYRTAERTAGQPAPVPHAQSFYTNHQRKEDQAMANKTYVVRLVDCDKANKNGVGDLAKDIQAKLSTWYTQVCQKASAATDTWGADVQWLDKPPGAAPPGQDAGNPLVINMLVYFVTSPRDSVIRLFSKGGDDAVNAIPDDRIGLTFVPGAGVASPRTTSEVYILRTTAMTNGASNQLALARCAIHESMHNQLNLRDSLHTGRTKFAAEIPDGDSPDGTELTLMAKSIGTLRPQWVEGFQAWMDKDTIH
jgi:hypothetical protein